MNYYNYYDIIKRILNWYHHGYQFVNRFYLVLNASIPQNLKYWIDTAKD